MYHKTLETKLLHKSAQLPKINIAQSAGYDLYAVEKMILKPGKTYLVRTGLSFNIPPGYFGKIYSRSGRSLQEDIDVYAGVIDSGYLGEIKVVIKRKFNMNHYLLNLIGINKIYHMFGKTSYNEIKIKPGERIAQIVFHKYENFNFKTISNFNANPERNTLGFGSSGK